VLPRCYQDTPGHRRKTNGGTSIRRLGLSNYLPNFSLGQRPPDALRAKNSRRRGIALPAGVDCATVAQNAGNGILGVSLSAPRLSPGNLTSRPFLMKRTLMGELKTTLLAWRVASYAEIQRSAANGHHSE
jgi:hypothetical protein